MHRFVVEGMVDNAARFASAGVAYHPYVETETGAGRGLLETLAARACVVVTDELPCSFLPTIVAAAGRKLGVRLVQVDSNGVLPLRATPGDFPTTYSFRRFLQRVLADSSSRGSLPGSVGSVPATPVRDSPRRARALAGRPRERCGASRGLRGPAADSLVAGSRPDALGTKTNGHRSGWWCTSPESESFLDQLVTWRELGYAFSFHRPHDYDRFESLPDWAKRTLEKQAHDPRPVLYSLDELDAAQTHDVVWNAAQRQLRREGHIHSYLRMLWGKKVFEWSEVLAKRPTG
jgi:deoxyribodipyrimidine photo-lyase